MKTINHNTVLKLLFLAMATSLLVMCKNKSDDSEFTRQEGSVNEPEKISGQNGTMVDTVSAGADSQAASGQQRHDGASGNNGSDGSRNTKDLGNSTSERANTQSTKGEPTQNAAGQPKQ